MILNSNVIKLGLQALTRTKSLDTIWSRQTLKLLGDPTAEAINHIRQTEWEIEWEC